TASAPVKVAVKNALSSIEPIAAFAPMFSISFCLSELLLITVTECPFATNFIASGLLIFPRERVTIIFMLLLFITTFLFLLPIPIFRERAMFHFCGVHRQPVPKDTLC